MSESPQEWILKRRHEDLGVTVRTNRHNKCGNRILHSTCGAGPGAHRGPPDSIASWHTAFHQAGGTRVFSSVGWLVQLRSNACHGRLVALRRFCSLGRSL